jgi:hypothetical protein
MERRLTGKIPRERIGTLELPRLPEDLLGPIPDGASVPDLAKAPRK